MYRKGFSSLLVLVALAGSAAMAGDHGSTEQSKTGGKRPWTETEKSAMSRFLQDPERFLQIEKAAFLKRLEGENPQKAKQIDSIFSKYESKLADLKKKTGEKDLNELLRDSQIRQELVSLEGDLQKVFDAMDGDLREAIEKLKEKSPLEYKEADWRELVDTISDREVREESHRVLTDIYTQSRELERLKGELRGRSLQDIGGEKLRELSDRSRSVRELETTVRDQVKRIEKDLSENGFLGDLKRAVRAVESDTKADVNKLRTHTNQEIDKVKGRLNKLFK